MDQWKEIFPKFPFTFRLNDLFSDDKNKENKIIIKETKLIRKEDAKKIHQFQRNYFMVIKFDCARFKRQTNQSNSSWCLQ